MISSIALLEPYRSALMTMGYDDGLVKVSEGIDWQSSPTYLIGKDEKLHQRVMMLSLLFDQVVIINHETEKDVDNLESQGLQVLSAKRLQDNEIVKFAETTTNKERLKNLETMRTYEDWWVIEKDLIKTWEPLIISQMMSKGKLPHPSIFNFVKSFRLGKEKDTQSALKQVPKKFANFMRENFNKNQRLPYDFIIVSTLNEILDVDQIISRNNTKIAVDGHFPIINTEKEIANENVDQIHNILIEAMIEDDLRFPLPENLLQLKSLKESDKIISFREVFQPWLTVLGSGDIGEERRLRKEVKKSIKQFKNYPKLSTAATLSAIVAIPIGLAGPIGTIIGTGLGGTSLGLSLLAKKWETRNGWVGLCT